MYIKHNGKVYKEINLSECSDFELKEIIKDLIKDNTPAFVSGPKSWTRSGGPGEISGGVVNLSSDN